MLWWKKNFLTVWQIWAKTLHPNKFPFGGGEANILYTAHITGWFLPLENTSHSVVFETAGGFPSRPSSLFCFLPSGKLRAAFCTCLSLAFLSEYPITPLVLPSFWYLNLYSNSLCCLTLEWFFPSFLFSSLFSFPPSFFFYFFIIELGQIWMKYLTYFKFFSVITLRR